MLQLAFANCVENKDQLLDKKTEEHFLTEVFTSNKIDSQGVKYNESLSPEWSQSSQSSAGLYICYFEPRERITAKQSLGVFLWGNRDLV